MIKEFSELTSRKTKRIHLRTSLIGIPNDLEARRIALADISRNTNKRVEYYWENHQLQKDFYDVSSTQITMSPKTFKETYKYEQIIYPL